MKSWREKPDCTENIEATKQHEREVFALQMQAAMSKEKKEHDTADRVQESSDADPEPS
jgi:hypothetical protein